MYICRCTFNAFTTHITVYFNSFITRESNDSKPNGIANRRYSANGDTS